ncbi:hypothetical protein STH861 [Symbiobacterium thermophilum IAM 14863]|uniref:Uncharacterized protein n=1 Tax=Symbiobacterium thermophilum (strain DSM 24528 / JCM 14929 / IAM 14863 / T) TaxID=292459 RepID=Q67R47_SYMTH|nr:hypothetical protein STH861 [Symbiobacterium thermophilum IAM 14863]
MERFAIPGWDSFLRSSECSLRSSLCSLASLYDRLPPAERVLVDRRAPVLGDRHTPGFHLVSSCQVRLQRIRVRTGSDLGLRMPRGTCVCSRLRLQATRYELPPPAARVLVDRRAPVLGDRNPPVFHLVNMRQVKIQRIRVRTGGDLSLRSPRGTCGRSRLRASASRYELHSPAARVLVDRHPPVPGDRHTPGFHLVSVRQVKIQRIRVRTGGDLSLRSPRGTCGRPRLRASASRYELHSPAARVLVDRHPPVPGDRHTPGFHLVSVRQVKIQRIRVRTGGDLSLRSPRRTCGRPRLRASASRYELHSPAARVLVDRHPPVPGDRHTPGFHLVSVRQVKLQRIRMRTGDDLDRFRRCGPVVAPVCAPARLQVRVSEGPRRAAVAAE